ncbi:MAG: hypothetical protein AAGJ35_16190, partial [Myxococcota bacterium]
MSRRMLCSILGIWGILFLSFSGVLVGCSSTEVCEEGQTVAAADGYNACVCTNGKMECSARAYQKITIQPKGCGSNQECLSGQVCTTFTACGQKPAQACVFPLTFACPAENQPVCGCDGK